eukprot:TRINITY_DN0_c1407_g1_i4.p3 TRINITY_DN0_c1407_g1~~TRINITY_DN0_c1407_g1_i4.p3  ORF type:complete len:145 (+),score=52.25 TRINITY_DN0_c1407_g1_i4:1-435(+)
MCIRDSKNSGGLSEKEIEDMVKKAEEMKEEDSKKKELINLRNDADTVIYQTEKSLTENKSKLQAGDITEIESEIASVKKIISQEKYERDELMQAMTKLKEAAQKIGKAVYESAKQTGGTEQQQEGQTEGTQNAERADENKEEKK